MQTRWIRWPLAFLVGGALTWHLAVPGLANGRIWQLASEPEVSAAFQADGGGTDALLVLLGFAFLTPLAVAGLIAGLVGVVKASERPLSGLRVPEWLTAPVIVAGCTGGIYAVSALWLPSLLYGLGLVARAYLVYSSSLSVLP